MAARPGIAACTAHLCTLPSRSPLDPDSGDEPISLLDNVPSHPLTLPLGRGIECGADFVGLPESHALHFEVGRLARLSHGACTARVGEHTVLAAAHSSRSLDESKNVMGLSVSIRDAAVRGSGAFYDAANPDGAGSAGAGSAGADMYTASLTASQQRDDGKKTVSNKESIRRDTVREDVDPGAAGASSSSSSSSRSAWSSTGVGGGGGGGGAGGGQTFSSDAGAALGAGGDLSTLARLVEAAVRPAFPYGYMYDTDLTLTLRRSRRAAAGDPSLPPFDAAVMAINAASASLCVSDIPFDGPVAAVRVVRDGPDGELRCALHDPVRRTGGEEGVAAEEGAATAGGSLAARGPGSLDILYAGSLRGAVLVRCASGEAEYTDLCEAMEFAQQALTPLLHAQMDLALAGGKEPRSCVILSPNRDCVVTTRTVTRKGLEDAFSDDTLSPEGRRDALDEVAEVTGRALGRHFGTLSGYDILESAALARYEIFRDLVIGKEIRPDGRERRETRTVFAEIEAVPGAHASSIFQRGETQALATVEVDHAHEVDGGRGDGLDPDHVPGEVVVDFHVPSFSRCEPMGTSLLGARRGGYGDLSRLALDAYFSIPAHARAATAAAKAAGGRRLRIDTELTSSDGSLAAAGLISASLALSTCDAFAAAPADDPGEAPSPIFAVSIGLLSTVEVGTHDTRSVHLLTDVSSCEEDYGDAVVTVAGSQRGGIAVTVDVRAPFVPVAGLCAAILEAAPSVRRGAGFVASFVDDVNSAPRDSKRRKTAKVARIPVPESSEFSSDSSTIDFLAESPAGTNNNLIGRSGKAQ